MRPYTYWLVVCAMAVSMWRAPACAQQEMEKGEIEKGVALFRSGYYDEAREWFETYLSSHPSDPVSYYYLGRCEPDGDRSQEYFRELLKRHPKHELADDALFALAQFRYAGGYYRTARKQYERLLQEYPRSNLAGRALYQIGLTFLATKESGQARRRFLEVRRRYPNSEWAASAAVGLVDAHVLDGNDEAAVASCDSLLRKSIGSSMKSHLLWTMARCCERAGRKGDAREVASRLVAEHPNSYEATLGRSLLQTLRTARTDSAAGYIVQAGAFRNITNATNLYNGLVAMALDVRVDSKMVEGRPFYVVLVGPYRTRDEAENVAESIRRSTEAQPQVRKVK